MRGVKFRGKRLDNGQWVCGFLFVNDTNQSFILPKSTLWRTESDGVKMRSVMSAHKVNPDTVGQYTDLKDKDGAEIWEGDIIKIRNPYNNCWSTDGAAVEFSTEYVGGWVISNESQNLNLGSRQNHIEVIGNIHDNPELLAGGR